MHWNNDKGGAVLITTIMVLLIGSILALVLLNSAKMGAKVSGNFKLSENAFNVAEVGFESLRNNLDDSIYNMLFYDSSDITKLYDPNFNFYDQITSGSGIYATYYSDKPTFKGTTSITLPDGQSLTGEWYARIVDNDIVCNTNTALIDSNGFLNPDQNGDGVFDNNLKGIMISCSEKDYVGSPDCSDLTAYDFSKSRDKTVFLEVRGLIKQGNTVLASKLVRVIINTPELAGFSRNNTQFGGSSAGMRSKVAAGVTPQQ